MFCGFAVIEHAGEPKKLRPHRSTQEQPEPARPTLAGSGNGDQHNMKRIRIVLKPYKTKPKKLATMRKELAALTFASQLLYVGNYRAAWMAARSKARQNPDDATLKHDAEVAEINFRNAFRETTGHEPPATMTDE